MLIENYKQIYKEIFSKINLEKVLIDYKINFKSYHTSKGKEFMCPCPFHDDSSPSFSINQKTGVFNCFVCGGGDFFKFIKLLEHFKSITEAISFLKCKVGISETEDVFSLVKNSSFDYFFDKQELKKETVEENVKIRLPQTEPAQDYFDIVKKRVSLETIKKYGMLYCKEDKIYSNRLVIPVYMEGELVTFAARDMSGKAETWSKIKEILKTKKISKAEKQKFIDKYYYKKILYPYGTQMGKIFFNWDEAIKNKKEVFICEGIFDAIRICQFGFNALALLSCHLNSYKTKKIIENFETIYITLDNDDKINSKGEKENPGQEAAFKIMKDHLTDVQVYNLILPKGKDPDGCTKEEFVKSLNVAKSKEKDFILPLNNF